jgi:hypothetical protein
MTAPAFPQMPSKPQERGAATTVSQRDRRFTSTFFDNYRHIRFPQGRPFTGQREFQSGSETESIAAGFLQSDLQCGEYFCENPETGQTPQERALTLGSVWTAPWLPVAKYFRFNYRAQRITYALDAMIADERQGLTRFWEAAAKAAGENDVIDPARPDAVPFRIRTLLGSPRTYMGKIRLAQAAQAGDPWLMGAVQTPNEELAKILGLGIVSYVGDTRYGDAEYVMVPGQVEKEPLLTPEAVLSVPMSQVQAMIADALAQHEAKRKAEAQTRMAHARASKKTEVNS